MKESRQCELSAFLFSDIMTTLYKKLEFGY